VSRTGARGVVVVAAVVAAVAGAAAVLTAAALPAVVAGVASALVAVLVLVEDPERDDAAREPPPAEVVVDVPSAPGPLPASDADADPLRALFESGPPAGGTGMLGSGFLHTTLRGRVAVARRSLRPLSVVCFEAHEIGADGQVGHPVPTDVVAAVLRRTLREADVSGHLERDAFVCILEDTGEDGAVWTAERVRRNLVEGGRSLRFRAGVASYPSHGLESEELEVKVRAALVAARDWGTDRIEVASAP
jgi:GGDEF domain-containing protein